MQPVRRAKKPIAQSKQHRRYEYGTAEIGGSAPNHVSDPPLDRLIEGSLVAGIRGPKRLPSTLDASRGERDAHDTVDQAQPAPRRSSRRREADDQDSRDHCDRQNQLHEKKGGHRPKRYSQPDQSERQAPHDEAGEDAAEDLASCYVPLGSSSLAITACCKNLVRDHRRLLSGSAATNGSKL